jgi:hypothetical protein
VMNSAVLTAKLGRDEEMRPLKRLDSEARRLEAPAEGPSPESFIAFERAASPALLGGQIGIRLGEGPDGQEIHAFRPPPELHRTTMASGSNSLPALNAEP